MGTLRQWPCLESGSHQTMTRLSNHLQSSPVIIPATFFWWIFDWNMSRVSKKNLAEIWDRWSKMIWVASSGLQWAPVFGRENSPCGWSFGQGQHHRKGVVGLTRQDQVVKSSICIYNIHTIILSTDYVYIYIYTYKGREGVGGFPTFLAASECQVGQTVLVATNESKRWWGTQRHQGATTTKIIWKYIYIWKYNKIHMK